MDFSGIGSAEILLILVVAVIVLGPGKIVKFSQTLGKMLNTLKKASSDLTTQVSKELDLEKESHSPQSEGKNSNKTKRSATSKSRKQRRDKQPQS